MIVERFKKGSIIPRRLKCIILDNRKVQYQYTFGCDVEVHYSSSNCLVFPKSADPVIRCENRGRKRNNGTKQPIATLIKNISIIGVREGE